MINEIDIHVILEINMTGINELELIVKEFFDYFSVKFSGVINFAYSIDYTDDPSNFDGVLTIAATEHKYGRLENKDIRYYDFIVDANEIPEYHHFYIFGEATMTIICKSFIVNKLNNYQRK